MDLVIKNGKIVDSNKIFTGNILINNGKIVGITDSNENGPTIQANKTIDAKGKFIFPGGVDPHVHFNEPGYTQREDFHHGTMAALAGGITTIVDMPLQNEPPLKDKDAFMNKEKTVSPNAYIDYSLWGAFINNNIDKFEEMKDCGISVFKAFMSSAGDDYPHVNNGVIKMAMEKALELDITLGFHCEDYFIIENEEKRMIEAGKNTRRDFLDSRPLVAELIATKNILDLAEATGAKVHICHVSHPSVAEEIKKAKAKGVRVTAETCTHYLIFTEQDLIEKGTLLKCAPPLRDEYAKEGLWQYILDGTLTAIVSDHSPALFKEKDDNGGKKSVWEVWSGISGVQTSFQIMFDEIYHKRNLCLTNITKLLSEGAAKAFNLFPQKGSLHMDTDADIVIVDPNKEWEIEESELLYTNKISGFTGLKGKGIAETVILRGNVVLEDGKIVGQPTGKLVK